MYIALSVHDKPHFYSEGQCNTHTWVTAAKYKQ